MGLFFCGVTSQPLVSREHCREASPPFAQPEQPPSSYLESFRFLAPVGLLAGPLARREVARELGMGWPSAVRSLLLPLALLLEPLGAQEHVTFRMNPVEKRDAGQGRELKLQCETINSSPTGCSWLRLTPGAVVPTFLLYLSGSSQSVKVAPELDSRRFGGSRSSSSYFLTLKDFQKDDQGYYYCVVARNSRLFFSPFVPVFMPVKATTAPAPRPKPTTPAATNSSIQSAAGSEKCKSFSNTSEKNGLDFSCDLYIWMPLTGGCVVLFLALIITITIFRRSRRRVCQCPRPLIRPGGKTGR